VSEKSFGERKKFFPKQNLKFWKKQKFCFGKNLVTLFLPKQKFFSWTKPSQKISRAPPGHRHGHLDLSSSS
jgi:hypothetical protein